jgi:hypothetical protein
VARVGESDLRALAVRLTAERMGDDKLPAVHIGQPRETNVKN